MWSEERELEREIERCGDEYRAEHLRAELMLVERAVRERRVRYESHRSR